MKFNTEKSSLPPDDSKEHDGTETDQWGLLGRSPVPWIEVGVKGIDTCSDLLTVEEAVAVRVGIEWVGTQINLITIWQSVRIGIVEPGVRPQSHLLDVCETVGVGVLPCVRTGGIDDGVGSRYLL